MNTLIERNFKLWAYTVSHGYLIIRSPMKFEDMDGYNSNTDYNIDIEFSDVKYIDISDSFVNVLIREIKGEIPAKFQKYLINNDVKVFELVHRDGTGFVVAGSYIIGRNKWITETRIMNVNLVHDEIIC